MAIAHAARAEGGLVSLGLRIVMALMASFQLSACAIEPGRVFLSQPRAYDSATSRQSIAKSGVTLSQSLRKDLKLDTVQEASSVAQAIAVSGRVGQTRGFPAPDPSASPMAAPSPSLPTTATAPATTLSLSGQAFGRTPEEQLEDAVHAETSVRGIELHHAVVDRPSRFGPDARVFVVEFDVTPIPRRQDYWRYPMLALQSGFGSVFNFTRTWFVEVEFQLPAFSPRDQMLMIHDVDPKQSVVTANDSLNNLKQAQFAALISSPTVTGQAEYLNRLEEAFAQQRRYPQQLGWHDGKDAFVWTYGPRRQVVARGWLARLNPFLSRYRVVSTLEPGLRKGYAVIIVPDMKKLRRTLNPDLRCAGDPAVLAPATAEPLSTVAERTASSVKQRDEARTYFAFGPALAKNLDAFVRVGLEDARKLTTCDDVVVPVTATARHLMLDRPDRVIAAPAAGAALSGETLSRDQECIPSANMGTAGKNCPGMLFLKLPVTPSEIPDSAIQTDVMSVTPYKGTDGSVDAGSMLVTLAVPGANFFEDPPRAIDVQYSILGQPWQSLRSAIDAVKQSSLTAIVQKPRKFDSEKEVIVRAIVTTERNIYGPRHGHSYSGAAGWTAKEKGDDEKVVLQPTSGLPGIRAQLKFGRFFDRTAADVDRIQFGGIDLGSGMWTTAGDRSITFAVPGIPAAQPIAKAAKHKVDVVVHFKPKGAAAAGSFTYESAP